MIEKQLIEIGLSEKEAKVYLAALELGPSTVIKIADKSTVNRATVYVIIEKLVNMGVFSTFEKGRKRYFVAEGPSSLKAIIRHQIDEVNIKDRLLDDMMPELKSLFNLHPHKPTVRFYEGKDALKNVTDILFEKDGITIDAMYPYDSAQETVDEDKIKKVGKKRSKQQIKSVEIYTCKKGKRPMSEYLEGLTKRFRVPSDKFPVKCEIDVTDDKVIFSTVEDYKTVIVEHKDIASTMRSLFSLARESAESHSKELGDKEE